ncbi:MAG TPA: DinB family protein [Novimethylophilus sp.]|jgi:uncharacterized damage-inducible protein DinB|uniref:DinB family protein n=1 Tax=Novimethylophilus sp. TaxID=2137426 RepID=UPI002F3E349E
MSFKQYFLYQADYQHWADDVLFNALDRLDEDTRRETRKLFFGSIHGTLDHLLFFFRKWHARLKGEHYAEGYGEVLYADWRELKNALRQEIRDLQRWLEYQPEEFFDGRLSYRRTLSREEKDVWVRDALTHVFTYASLERGHISAAGSALGAPFPDMAYYTYRLEMGEHLENMRKI